MHRFISVNIVSNPHIKMLSIEEQHMLCVYVSIVVLSTHNLHTSDILSFKFKTNLIYRDLQSICKCQMLLI